MKKKIVNALLVIMSLGVLTGCGGTGSNPSSPVTGLNPAPSSLMSLGLRQRISPDRTSPVRKKRR